MSPITAMLIIFHGMSLLGLMAVLISCLSAIKDWMANDFFKVREKTEGLIIVSDSIAPKVVIALDHSLQR